MAPSSMAPSPIVEIDRLYKMLFFEQAMAVCDQALAGGGNDRQTTSELLQWKGILAATRGDAETAQWAFRQMLYRDPSAKIGDQHSQRISDSFGTAQTWASEQPPLQVELSTPDSLPRNQPLQLELIVAHDALNVTGKAVLYLRSAGSPDYEEIMLAKAPFSWQLAVDNLPRFDAAETLEYYVTVLDGSSNEITQIASREQPLSVLLTAPIALKDAPKVASPIYKRWWFWTAIGLVAAGAGAGAGYYLTRDDSVTGTIVVSGN